MPMKLLVITILFAATHLVPASAAGASDHLDGVFVLDPEQSDDPTAMMAAMGLTVNKVTRAAARAVKTRLVIDGEQSQVTITVKTPLAKTTVVLPNDGSLVPVAAQLGSGQGRATWTNGGAELITEMDTVLDDGRKVSARIHRSMMDADTLVQISETTIDGFDTVTMRRVYRRK